MNLIIEDEEGRKTVIPFAREEITVGRHEGNTVRLGERNVSRRHARLSRGDGSLVIEDLGSRNGVRVNGDRIRGPTRVGEGDLIEIGDYGLAIQDRRSSGKAVPDAALAGPSGPALAETAIIRAADVRRTPPGAAARNLAASETPRLVCIAGHSRGLQYELDRSNLTVGRTADNDLQFDHPSVSRRHCRFALEGGGWKIYDDDSANGVRVNGERYAVAAVKPGDTVELGHLQFNFCGPGEPFAVPRRTGDEDSSGHGAVAATLVPPRADGRGAASARWNRGSLVAGMGLAALAAFAAVTARGRSGAAGEAASAAGASVPVEAAAAANATAPNKAPPSSASRATAAAARDDRDQAARDALASRAIQQGNAKVQAHEYQDAIARFTEALNHKPGKPLLAMAYRGLGIAYVYAGDAKRGVQYFKLYLPFCPDAERQQLEQTIARYGG
jgi:pSer/pThr/pTyr-binding forkhead associated (FHA) protein